MTATVLPWFKDYAPVATVVSAVVALLLDRFKVVPTRYLPYAFWCGSFVFFLITISSRIMTEFLAGTLWTRIESSVLLTVCFGIGVSMIVKSGAYIPAVRIQLGDSVAHTSQSEHALVRTETKSEPINDYWRMGDFTILARCRNRSSRFKSLTTVRLTGGSVLLDAVLYNISGEPILLEELECKTISYQPGYFMSAGAGALPVSGVYAIEASIGNAHVARDMEPRLHVPAGEPIRILVLFTADMTGYQNPHFRFWIGLRGEGTRMAKLGPFRLSFRQLEKSMAETTEELEQRWASNPNDVPTMIHYAQALDATHDSDRAHKMFEKARQVEPDNPEVLRFFVSQTHDGEEKIRLYYRLEALRPDLARECSSGVVYAITDRATTEAQECRFDAYRRSINEGRRIAKADATRSAETRILEHEIALAILDNDMPLAVEGTSRLGTMQGWTEPGLDWQRDAFLRLLKKILADGFNDNVRDRLLGVKKAESAFEQSRRT